MDLDIGSSTSTSSGLQVSRKERGVIATQRLDIPCIYREPQPTKKNKTLTEVLDCLKSVEVKVDRLSSRPPQSGFGLLQPLFGVSGEVDYRSSFSSVYTIYSPSPCNNLPKTYEYRYSTVTYKLLHWPAIQEILL
ncbi:hypothetical protein CJF31_00009122 [Rutstroemia sp. NJR-2017a BVV2]|nr:hypothetical protein CJF31_00009122 [Rutstroemia sp. NJR-2017a BVV2]